MIHSGAEFGGRLVEAAFLLGRQELENRTLLTESSPSFSPSVGSPDRKILEFRSGSRSQEASDGDQSKERKGRRLARQVAAGTGESLTDAIIGPVEERLERLKRRRSDPDLVETLMTISRRCSSLPDLDTRSADEILRYDEKGTFD